MSAHQPCRATLSRFVPLLVVTAVLAPRVSAGGSPRVNTALEVRDDTALAGIHRVAVVCGVSATFDKKTKAVTIGVIKPTAKLAKQLALAIQERGGPNLQIVGDGTAVVDLVDPFELERRAGEAPGGRGSRVPLTWTERAWQECGNCPLAMGADQPDALWVVWGRWFSEPMTDEPGKVHYTDEKGWLHGSAHLFDSSGKLIAITSMNRTGFGALVVMNYGYAYSAIGRAMVKSFLKHQGVAQDTTETD